MEPIWLTLSSQITLSNDTIMEIVAESQLCSLIGTKIKETKQPAMTIKVNDFVDLLLDYHNALQQYVQKKIKEAGPTEDLMLHHNREIVAIKFYLDQIPQNVSRQSNSIKS